MHLKLKMILMLSYRGLFVAILILTFCTLQLDSATTEFYVATCGEFTVFCFTGQHSAPIGVKLSVKEHTLGSPCLLNFTLIG